MNTFELSGVVDRENIPDVERGRRLRRPLETVAGPPDPLLWEPKWSFGAAGLRDLHPPQCNYPDHLLRRPCSVPGWTKRVHVGFFPIRAAFPINRRISPAT